jgi:uncharacterized membrane protein YfcA
MPAFLSGFDNQTISLLVLIGGVAGLARGFSGFGAALIFMPAASALVTPAVAAPVLLIADGVLALGFLPGAWAKAHKADVALMAAGAAAGVPLGVLILNHADPLALRWAIAILASLMLALLMSGWRYGGKPQAPVTVGVGALSGLFGGLAQLSGPPVVAYWLTGRAPPIAMRANIILFFGATTLFSVVSYLVAGVMTVTSFKLAVLVGPLYGIGLYAGARLFGIASEAAFRRLCFLLIAISVAVSLPVWQ